MTAAEFAALKASIAVVGQADPIVLVRGKIIDGRHRYRACVELGIRPVTVEFDGTDALGYVIARAHHRNMSEAQKAACAVTVEAHVAAARKAGDAVGIDGKTRDHVGNLFGVSGKYVGEAKALYAANREAFARVFAGVAHAKEARKHRRSNADGEAWEVITGDALAELDKVPAGSVRLIVTDPPYNIGIDYGNGAKADRLSPTAYAVFTGEWIAACHRALADDGAIFVIVSSALADAVGITLSHKFGPECRRSTIVWHETFGTYQAGNFTDCWRAIHYYTKSKSDYVWHGDQILIPSDRQTKYGDARANPTGKVPGNVWTEFPRLVDNAAERVPGFPTQIPWRLVERIVRVASDPGDLVADPFNGSGTTGEACLRNARRYLGIEAVADNASIARARLTNVAAEVAAKGAKTKGGPHAA
jgi:site-specific DNA-methyltransferase (adenine-specific)